MWKRQFASDDFCSRGPWPEKETRDSRSGCCSRGNSRGGGDPSPGQPARHWKKSLRDDFKAFGALHGSTSTDRRTFEVDRLIWIDAARKKEGVRWYTGVLLGAERFMASWHKHQEEASRLREVIRAAKALLANQKTKRGNSEEEGGGEREGKRRSGASSNSE